MGATESLRKSIIGKGIPLPGDDIDTDRIIPARYLREITFESLGQYAFYDARYDEVGNKKDHPLNDARFTNGTILIVNRNFGCGSSREHAPQALMRMGITGFIGESFAEIFSGNCTALGLPALRVSGDVARKLIDSVSTNPEMGIELNLDNLSIKAGSDIYKCTMPETDRQSLIAGTWDTLSVLLANKPEIQTTAARLPYINGFKVY